MDAVITVSCRILSNNVVVVLYFYTVEVVFLRIIKAEIVLAKRIVFGDAVTNHAQRNVV